MIFKQPMWMIGMGHLLGVACIAAGLALVAGGHEWRWLLLWPVFHVVGALMTSVGLHRYFSHGAFKTSPFWHRLMAFYSVFLLSGSPHGWSAAHITHHLHADTERDPHVVDASYLVWKHYRNVPMARRRLRHLMHDPTLAFVHRYGALLWILGAGALALVSWQAFIFGYGMALGSVHTIGAIHQVTNHKDGAARDWPILEYLLPAMGEWNHRTHHEHWSRRSLRTRWWHLDLGAGFIRLIASG